MKNPSNGIMTICPAKVETPAKPSQPKEKSERSKKSKNNQPKIPDDPVRLLLMDE